MSQLQRLPLALPVRVALGRQNHLVLLRNLRRVAEAAEPVAGQANGVYEYRAKCSSGQVNGRGVRIVVR